MLASELARPAIRERGLAKFRKHEPVTSSESDARAIFEAKVQSLVGRRILAVDYWDIHNFSPSQLAGTTATGTTPS